LIRDAVKKPSVDIFDYERPVGIQFFCGDEDAMEMSSQLVMLFNQIWWISILDVP
jgi:hypothetical protein